MNKVKEILLSTNFTVSVFVLIGLRITVMGASIGDALAIGALCALQGFNKWLETQTREDINEKLAQELTDIKSHVSALMIKNSTRPSTPPVEQPAVKRFF